MRKMNLSQSIKNYVQSLEKLDWNDCPLKFKTAFLGHLKAWKDILVITDKHPALRGEMHDLFKEIELGKDSVLFKAAVEEIWNTWADVEQFKPSKS